MPHHLEPRSLPPSSRPVSGLGGEALLRHQPLAGAARGGGADEGDEEAGGDPEGGDDRVPGRSIRRVRVDVAEERVADDEEGQERHDDLPGGYQPPAGEEQQPRGPDGGEGVDEEQYQRPDGARGHEQVERRHAEDEPAERDDDVHGEGDGRRGAHRDAIRGGDGADRKSTRLNSSHANISYAVFCLKKKK